MSKKQPNQGDEVANVMPYKHMTDFQLDAVLEKIRLVFPGRDPKEILSCLEDYGAESRETEKYRVYLAILKLCEEEKLSDPSPYVKAAKQDFRDVLAWAEYPNQMKHGPARDPEQSARLIKQDQEQLQAWLSKT